MVISLILLFLTCMFLSFFEESIHQRDKKIIYIILGIAMVLIAGLRELGSTPDMDTYESMFYAKRNNLMMLLREPSFSLITDILQSMSIGVTGLFLTYALIAVPIQLSALWKLSKMPLLTLTIYISYYYMIHDMVQIRCAVASGLFLWAIYFYANQKKLYTLLCILMGTYFHYSAIAGLAIFFLGNGFPKWQRYVLCAIVPIGMVVYFSHFDILSFIPSEWGGTKLMSYRTMREKGLEDELAGWKLQSNLLIWMNIVLYYACIYYHDHLAKHFKYTSVAIKLNEQALSMDISDLASGDARAVYRSTQYDLRNYGKLKMFVHAEKKSEASTMEDDDLVLFVRLGSDYTNNYYEYEVPLKFSDWGVGKDDPYAIWPRENNVEIDLTKLVDIKTNRKTFPIAASCFTVNTWMEGSTLFWALPI